VTSAQAQQVVSDLIANGYDAYATQVSAGAWQVSARSPTNVAQATAQQFAANHVVSMQSYQTSTSVTFF
jgi:hypothetical protein